MTSIGRYLGDCILAQSITGYDLMNIPPQEPNKLCGPSGLTCFEELASAGQDLCMVSCLGLYADVSFTNETILDFLESRGEEAQKLDELQQEYNRYKNDYVSNVYFDPKETNNSKCCIYSHILTIIPSFLAGIQWLTQLEVVHIYFDTATFDEIEKDVKVTLEGQLGVIGGTMGLLTGFSILSGVEIVYYALKVFFMLTQRSTVRSKDIDKHMT